MRRADRRPNSCGRRMRALDRKLLRDLRHIWMQALAIALVIGCGVAMYVMSFGTLRSLDETRVAYYERYRFADVFASVKRAPERLASRIAAIPGVGRVETRIVAHVTLDVAGMDEPASGLLVSQPERGEALLNLLHVRKGRRIAPGRTGEVVVGEPFAEAHGLGPGDHLFAVINGRKRRLDIVGVALSPEFIYALGPGAIMPDDRRFGILWIGHETLAAAFDLEDSFNDVSLTILRGTSEATVIAELDRLLEPYGTAGAYGRKDHASHWWLSNELTQLDAMGSMMSPIFLGVAAFLLHIVASRLIATEREQIGLLKAFGYSGLEVGWHYAKLVLTIVALGVVFGFAGGAWLGRGLTELYTNFFRFPFLYYRLEPAVFVLASLVSFGVGLLGALGAVRQAATLPPAVAMQPAAPPVYRKTMLERIGLTGRLAQPTRMILRHLMRRPVRAGLTSLGIAMAAAVMISSMFMRDALDLVIDIQFNQVHRQDVTVSFSELSPARILHDLESLPGVLRAEPARTVPVRLRMGNRSRTVGLVGVSPGADLSRIVDTGLRPVAPPPEGLMLSTILSEAIGAGLGDRVRIEVQEGRRQKLEVPVTLVVEEYFGATAYMEMSALNRLLGEGDIVNGAYLQIDKSSEAALYRALKNAPAVAGVVVETAAVESFRETLAENLLLMTTFNVMFSGLIAFGVVYNSARISLSERGRELASLRVLGFTRGEISWILLGEFALLTLASLPLGWLIGYGLAALVTMNIKTELFHFPLYIEIRTYGFAALVVVLSALVTGLAVRRRIDHLDLVAVLKTRE